MNSGDTKKQGGGGTTDALSKVKSVYSFWGRFSTLYAAQDLVTFMGRPHRIRSRAVAKLRVRSGDRVLEVACGTGRNFSYLVEAIGPRGQLVGFDYSQEMLDAAGHLCRRRGWQNVSLVKGDAAELDIGDGGFDAVLSVLGISAIPDYQGALERCKEVLRPGGVLSVCDGRLFAGRLRVLNPLVRTIYRRWAAWDPSKDILATMREVFGNVTVEDLNRGTLFIATSIKSEV